MIRLRIRALIDRRLVDDIQGVSRQSLVAHHLPGGAYVQDIPYFFGMEGKRKILEFIGTDAGRFMQSMQR